MKFSMRHLLFGLLACVIVLGSCKENKQKETTGSLVMLVDESFMPIVEDEVIVFQNIYKTAKIDARYMNERAVINGLLSDSSSIGITSRRLTRQEAGILEKRNYKIRENRVAVDAVALIANGSSRDTTISVQEIVDILQGKPSARQLVFDNPNSSIVRYLMELANIKVLPSKGVYALQTNSEVIKYVHNNKGAIGVISYNWVRQPTVELEPLVATLKVMAVKGLPGKPGSDKYYRPNQDNLALEQYPLSRNMYIINYHGGGLGLGFSAFLAGDVGQRVILKSGLLPDSIPPREIIIRK